MKIIHLTWSLCFGGIETMLVNIANAQAREGADVKIVLINELYEQSLIEKISPKVEVKYLHRRVGSRNLWWIVKLNYYLRKENPDAIHMHGSLFYRLIAGRRLSRGACSTLHALPTGSVRRGGLLAKAFPPLDLKTDGNVTNIDLVPRVFAISEAVKDALWKQYGVKSTVVSNGIDTAIFQTRAARPVGNPMRMVQVGRLEHDKKGQDLLIRAVANLKSQVVLDLIGIGSSMDYLKQLTAELGADAYVNFLGKQTQDYIATHLKDYDLFAHPARYEGFGLTVAEAMAAGVPVLVSAGQGPAEVTCGEKYGWVFENGDVDGLTAQIGHVLSNYDAALEKAARARDYVINTYDVSITARRYIELYRK